MDALESPCKSPGDAPQVLHVVVSLAHGGLERLVVDWTNARNRRHPGSTRIVCLDEAGELASQVEGDPVIVLGADRSRSPWDREAVAALRRGVRGGGQGVGFGGQGVGFRVQGSGFRGQRTEDRDQRTAGLSGSSPSSTLPIDPEPLTLNPVALPSLLHAHNLAAWQYAVLAAWGTGVRIVYTQHGANAHNQRLTDRLRGRVLACFTDEVVAVSKATARTMGRLLWIPRSGIRVVANGVDTARVQVSESGVQPSADRRRVREQLGIPVNAVVLGSVGRLAHVKGYDRLIKALGGMSGSQEPESGRRNPEHRTLNPPFLLLVGDGPERAALTALAQSPGLSDRVRFAGFHSEPRRFLDAMDLFVLPSRSEGLSMGLLEAMAAGVPVAVTDAGANREVVDNGACGILLPEDASLWPAIFKTALENPADLRAMADRAGSQVVTHYSLRATLDGYERIYRRLTSGGRGGCGDDCACGKR